MLSRSSSASFQVIWSHLISPSPFIFSLFILEKKLFPRMTPVDYPGLSDMINTLPYIVHHLFFSLWGPESNVLFCSLLPQQISSPVLYLQKDIFPDVCALHSLADWMTVVRMVINPMLAWCVWGAARGQTHGTTINGCPEKWQPEIVWTFFLPLPLQLQQITEGNPECLSITVWTGSCHLQPGCCKVEKDTSG